MYRCVSPWVYPVWDSLCFLDLIDYCLSYVGDSTIISSKIFSMPFFPSSGTPITGMMIYLILSKRSLRLSAIFSFLPLYSALQQLFQPLCPPAHLSLPLSVILLLVPSRVFFNFSDCVVHLSLFILYFFYVLGDCINCVKCFLHFLHSIFKSSEHLYSHYSESSFREIGSFLFIYLVL